MGLMSREVGVYRKFFNKRRGAYSKTFQYFAALIKGRPFFEGGVYSKRDEKSMNMKQNILYTATIKVPMT